MNKLIITLMAIYLLGDLKTYVVAAALALVSMPWNAAQADG